MSYLIYARRSTDDHENQRNSLSYQLERCMKFARSANLALSTFTETGFCENGIIQERHTAYKTSALEFTKSGSVAYRIERPKFNQLVQRLSRSEFSGVIAMSSDRLSRNPLDHAVLVELINRGVDVRYVDTVYEANSAGALHRDIDASFNVHWSRTSSERVRNVNRKLRDEGKSTQRAPLGYVEQGSDKILDLIRAPIIRRIFELYATGEWTIRQLTIWANRQGLTMRPMRRRRTVDEMAADEAVVIEPVTRPMTDTNLHRMLRNPFYMGKFVYNGEVRQGTHEAIISPELFHKVQRILKQRARGVYYVEKRPFVFRGMVRCACGRLYTPYRKKDRYVYYASTCRAGCANAVKIVSERGLHAEVERLFDAASLTEPVAKALFAKQRDIESRAEKERESTLETLRRQLEVVARDLAYLEENKLSLLQSRVFTPDTLKDEYLKLDSRKVAAEAAMKNGMEAAEHARNKPLVTIRELVKLAKTAYKLAPEAERRALALATFPELQVVDGKLASAQARAGVDRLLAENLTPAGAQTAVFPELKPIPPYHKSLAETIERLRAALGCG